MPDPIERTPDHDPEAERAAVGVALIDAQATATLCRMLKPEHFYRPDLGLVFRVIANLHAAGEPVDLVSVAGRLATGGLLNRAGGETGVAELAECGLAPNAEYYAGRVLEGWRRRQARGALNDALLDLDEGRSIEKVLTRLHTAVPARPAEEDVAASRPVLVRVIDVASRPVHWLWPGRIPRGKVSLVAGDPGLGKSLLTLDVAARVTRGCGWPDAPDTRGEPAGVLILSAEDDVADTIRPRLEAAGADIGRVTVLQGVQHGEGACRLLQAFRLDADLPALERALAETPGCALVVIDPVSAYLGRADSHVNAEVRAVLAALKDVAERHGVAVVGVHHLNKGLAGSALYRVTGSLGFVAAPRAVWLVTKDRGNPERRLFLPSKNNLGRQDNGLAFGIVDSQDVQDAAVVAWERGPVSITADEALGADEDERGKVEEAADWLRDVLSNGPVAMREVERLASEAGVRRRTLIRAKKGLRVESAKRGFGSESEWAWALPEWDHNEECQDLPFEALAPFGGA